MTSAQLPADLREPVTETRKAPGLPPGPPSRAILGQRVDATSYAETTEAVAAMARAGEGGVVCVSTVHMVMESFDDPDYRRLVNRAERVTPDGMPLVWGLSALGCRGAERVYGPSLLGHVCARAAREGIPVGFYGGTPEVLDALLARLCEDHLGLQVAFAYAPPFRPLTPDEENGVLRAIEGSGTRILFVALGCPRQERWMAAHRERLSCAQLGVGAAFDFLAGAKPQAPAWVQRAGLEWLFRLGCEPRRLWRRYLWHNPRFVWHFGRQLAAERARRASAAPGVRV